MALKELFGLLTSDLTVEARTLSEQIDINLSQNRTNEANLLNSQLQQKIRAIERLKAIESFGVRRLAELGVDCEIDIRKILADVSDRPQTQTPNTDSVPISRDSHKTEPRRFQKFPWSNRTSKQWLALVSREEFTRTAFLACLQEGISFANNLPPTIEEQELANIMKKWELAIPYELFWKGDITKAHSEMTTLAIKDSFPDSDELHNISSTVQDILDNPRLYQYLLTQRKVLKERNRQRKIISRDAPPIHEDLKWILDLSDADAEMLAAKTQQLSELLFPLSYKKASYRRNLISPQSDEWIGIAGLRLSLTVAHFYWEPAFIDPYWTTSLFTRVLYRSLQDPSALKFDTHTLELQTENLHLFASADNTEQLIIERDQRDNIVNLIRNHTPNEMEARIIQMRVIDGIKEEEIAKKLNIDIKYIKNAALNFRKRIRKNTDVVNTVITSPETRRNQRENFWNKLFEELPKYEKIFNEKSGMLIDFHRELLTLFFQLQTGEKLSTFDAIHEYYTQNNRQVLKETIRRQVQRSINIMLNIEKSNARHGQIDSGWGKKRKKDLVQKVAQNPQFWNTLSEKRRTILTLKFLSEGKTPTNVEIAKKVNVHESTISREIDKAFRDIYRFLGSSPQDSRQMFKSRQHLPK